jgi:lysophospholipase L1-like esterase
MLLHRMKLFVVLQGLFLISFALSGQDPLRFKKEVDSIVARNSSVDKTNLIVFTGSSSIRLWKDLKSSFPGHNVVNLGFGGSEMADLFYFTDQLIISFQPSQIFIYEGDNDISFGRTSQQIIAFADSILTRIRQSSPSVEVVFMSPKPSLARWNLKSKYEAFNKEYKKWAAGKKNVRYVDLWTPMLDKNGVVRRDIFIVDGLHLNSTGYAIWKNTLQKYLRPLRN